jgi:hypothetical protein
VLGVLAMRRDQLHELVRRHVLPLVQAAPGQKQAVYEDVGADLRANIDRLRCTAGKYGTCGAAIALRGDELLVQVISWSQRHVFPSRRLPITSSPSTIASVILEHLGV